MAGLQTSHPLRSQIRPDAGGGERRRCRLDHRRARVLQAGRSAGASREDVEGDGSSVDVAGHPRLGANGGVEVGIGGSGHRHRVPAGQHRERLHERPGRRLLQQIREHEDERALDAADVGERELVVALERARARDRTAPIRRRARRRAAAAGTAVPRRRTRSRRTRSPRTSATAATATAASSAASRRVRSPNGAAMRRPQSMTQTTSRSRSIRYWLLIGRSSRAVARQFTWRMSSSGSSRAPTRTPCRDRAARGGGALRRGTCRRGRRWRGGERRAGRDRRRTSAGSPTAMRPRAEPERPSLPHDAAPEACVGRGAAQRAVLPAPPPPAPARARDRAAAAGERGCARAPLVRGGTQSGDSAGEMRRARAARPPAAAHPTRRRRRLPRASATARRIASGTGRTSSDSDDERQRERGARRRRHRGTGTVSRAARTASSAEYRSSSASGRSRIRCRSTSDATSATSSGVT